MKLLVVLNNWMNLSRSRYRFWVLTAERIGALGSTVYYRTLVAGSRERGGSGEVAPR
jgi:hypothetical protein